MKKLIFVLFFLVTQSHSELIAQKKNVSEKFISEVLSYYSVLPEFSDEFSVFWNFVRDNNIKYQEYVNNQSNMKYNTIGKVYSDLSLSRNVLDLFTLDTLSSDEGIRLAVDYVGKFRAIKGIWIYPENIINATAYPTGEIFVGLGLFDLPRKSNLAINGVIAHEIAHICLDHSEVYAYNNAKTERKNEIWGSIAAGLVVAADAGSSFYSASNGVPVSDDYYEKKGGYALSIAKGLKSSFNDATILKKFEYSREQEIEADYLEKINFGYLDYIKTQKDLNVLVIDISDKDFVKNQQDYLYILNEISQRIK